MAYTKKTANKPVTDDVKEPEEVEVEKKVIAEEVEEVKKKEYAPQDLIDIRSITQGVLIFNGLKSHNNYTWSGYGDVNPVEYQDLLSELVSGGNFLFKPYFVIEDMELLEQPRWGQVKKLYDSMYAPSDINDILYVKSVKDFEATLMNAPEGLKSAIKSAVADAVANNSFDSIQKVKIIDKVCGTEISKLMLE
jgi:hypothetical protein